MGLASTVDLLVYTSPLFGRASGDSAELTIAYAECCLDPLGQPVIRIVDWGLAGTASRFEWGGVGADFIRYDAARHTIEHVQVLHDLGPGTELVGSWPLEEIHEAELQWAAADDLERAMLLVFEVVGPTLGIRPLDTFTVEHCEQTDLPEFRDRLAALGLMSSEALTSRVPSR